jgi:hypothetical protein
LDTVWLEYARISTAAYSTSKQGTVDIGTSAASRQGKAREIVFLIVPYGCNSSKSRTAAAAAVTATAAVAGAAAVTPTCADCSLLDQVPPLNPWLHHNLDA